MKKTIFTSALISMILVPTVTIATSEDYTSAMPINMEDTINFDKADISDENQIIIRNNKLESDYNYNNTHYFTSKLKAKNIVIPDDIKQQSSKIYFLVEEGSRVYHMEDSVMGKGGASEVKDVYNYKIVDFVESKEEYLFENKDLIKDFGNNEYVGVSITIMADMNDGTKIALSNPAYIDIASKKVVLSNLVSENNMDRYYGYYNTSKLEDYLLTYSDSLSRNQYKKILNRADSKIKSALMKNKNSMDDLVSSIKKESDFEEKINKFQALNETSQLLNSLNTAVKNQIQSVRAYDIIDVILK